MRSTARIAKTPNELPSMSLHTSARTSDAHCEEVEISGHIIDSLLLPKILDQITSLGGAFLIKQIAIGQARTDPSYALVEVSAPTDDALSEILKQISDHGAVPTTSSD